MERMRHGYTNDTVGDASVIRKSYRGSDAAERQEREEHALTALRGLVPVPAVISSEEGTLVLARVEGVHGQELLGAGDAGAVLEACGVTLRRLHGLDASGQTLVHGDYGPNNVLLDPRTYEITAVLDWEWAHRGDPIEDVAWCEWIVRMHHPSQKHHLSRFFDTYGQRPRWERRQAEMVRRCEEFRQLCEKEEKGGPAVGEWGRRKAVTAGWVE